MARVVLPQGLNVFGGLKPMAVDQRMLRVPACQCARHGHRVLQAVANPTIDTRDRLPGARNP